MPCCLETLVTLAIFLKKRYNKGDMNKRAVPLFVIAVVFFCQAVIAQEVSFDAIAGQKERIFAIPAITKVVVAPSSTGVRIEWDTDVPAQSFIEYGESPAYGNRTPSMSETVKAETSHRAELTGLSEFRTYHFRIRASEERNANEFFSRALTFTTLPSGEHSSPALYPTPFDFSAPRITSFAHDDKDGFSEISVTTHEASLTKFEAGVYTRGAPFLFEERDISAQREERTRFVLSSTTPGMLYLYRLTTQDRLGNRALVYGNFQTEPIARHSEQSEESRAVSGQRDPSSSSRDVRKNDAPANSVLITRPSQLIGIPKGDVWKDETSGRLYRIFHTMPPRASLLTHPSQLAGLTVFHVWKDEKSGRLYSHAGVPNPAGNGVSKSNARNISKESSENKEAQESNARDARIPKQWIRITHPLQLKVLFPNEVWRDPESGVMYRKVAFYR